MFGLKKALAGVTAALLIAASAGAGAANILFAHVGKYGAYIDDGNRIAQFLSNGGHTVTVRYLSDAVYGDYASFDQIFVYDLYAGADNTVFQNANYQRIADWYNGLTDQNLILDGRIISSDVWWTNANSNMPSEEKWIQNYATQLALRGGGLMLGTDHNSFQSGINQINVGIQVAQFSGFFGSYPTSQAVVDTQSPLYNAGLGLANCRADATRKCINDNSTTGFVATGAQLNGQTLTPVAYHGDNLNAWDFAAVSSTFGSRTFGTCGGPGQPPCVNPLPAPALLMGLGLLCLGALRRRGRQSR